MKKLCAGFLIFVFAVGAQAKVPKLILGEADGLPVECEVCGYDVEKGLVKLRAGDKRGARPFESFSEDAQSKIVGWASDNAFDSSAGLKIRIEERVETSKEKNGKVDKVTYLISLKNQSPFEMKNVSLRSQIFYESLHRETNGYRSYYPGYSVVTGTTGTQDVENKSKSVSVGNVTFSLRPNQEVLFTTSGVRIRDLSTHGLTAVVNEDKLLGILCVLKKTAWDRQTLMRDFEDGRVPREKKRKEYAPKMGGISKKAG